MRQRGDIELGNCMTEDKRATVKSNVQAAAAANQSSHSLQLKPVQLPNSWTHESCVQQ